MDKECKENQNFQGAWDNIKWSNIYVIWETERKKERMGKNFWKNNGQPHQKIN